MHSSDSISRACSPASASSRRGGTSSCISGDGGLHAPALRHRCRRPRQEKHRDLRTTPGQPSSSLEHPDIERRSPGHAFAPRRLRFLRPNGGGSALREPTPGRRSRPSARREQATWLGADASAELGTVLMEEGHLAQRRRRDRRERAPLTPGVTVCGRPPRLRWVAQAVSNRWRSHAGSCRVRRRAWGRNGLVRACR